jgi:hypothetical protein
MNEEKKDYKGLYYNEEINNNDEENHSFEYGAHFKYKDLYRKLSEIVKERNKDNIELKKNMKIHGNNNVLKGISRNKVNNNINGDNFLNYLKNFNNITSSKINESYKSASYNKINENKIKTLSNKNTINQIKNTRTILRNALFQKTTTKLNNNNNIFTNKKNHNSKNSSSKLTEKILYMDKSSKSVSIKHQNRNHSTSRKINLNNQIFQIQSHKLKIQIKNYFNEKYFKLFSKYNSLYKKISPNKKNTNSNNETINKKNSIPLSRNNNIQSKKKIKKNIINIIDSKFISKNPSTQSLTSNENINIKKKVNQTNNKNNNKSTFINNNMYYNTIQTQKVPVISIINLLNTSGTKEKLTPDKILSILLNKKVKKKRNNLSSSKERSSVSSSIKHSLFPSNKTGSTMNSTQKGKYKMKQKMNKPSLVLKNK